MNEKRQDLKVVTFWQDTRFQSSVWNIYDGWMDRHLPHEQHDHLFNLPSVLWGFHSELWPWSLTYAAFVPALSRYNCFPFKTPPLPFFFVRSIFWRAVCWCSFQLFFRLSPLTWIGSAGLVSARRQDPDYPSQCVTSMGPEQAAPPNELCLPRAAPSMHPP